MITLHGFGPRFGIADASPFVLKVDLYLRVLGLEFETIADPSNLQKAPKGKLPFMAVDGSIIADSHFIIDYLDKKNSPEIDKDLTQEQRATAYLLSKSLDENLYWCIVYSRWIREDTWPIVSNEFFSSMPFPLNKIVPIVARRDVRKTLNKQGISRHTDAEIDEIADLSLKSLSVILGDKQYFFGEKLSTFDITAFAFLAQLTIVSLDNSLCQLSRQYNNLVDFCSRIQNHYYSDL